MANGLKDCCYTDEGTTLEGKNDVFISSYFLAGPSCRLRIFGQISLPSVRSGFAAIPSCEGDFPTHLLSRPLTSMRPLDGSMVRVVKRLSR